MIHCAQMGPSHAPAAVAQPPISATGGLAWPQVPCACGDEAHVTSAQVPHCVRSASTTEQSGTTERHRSGSPASSEAGRPAAPVGSRKRKAYRPRNSGDDFGSPPSRSPSPAAKRAQARPKVPTLKGVPHLSSNGRDRARRDKSAKDALAPSAAPSKRSVQKEEDTHSLAATRPRRVAKTRSKFDPQAFDLSVEGDDSKSAQMSEDSGDAEPRRGECGGPKSSHANRTPRSSAAEATMLAAAQMSTCLLEPSIGGRAGRAGCTTGTVSTISDEQRMFQEFRKQSCMAYTGVVVHCQNMKLEARVNMVSYIPERERKISGGQIYIAYMSNPHQAAIVHDITASIMTAEGIPIFHSQNCHPSINRDVALERLNYLDTLETNTQRGAGRFGEREMQAGARKVSCEEHARRRFMLSPAELRHELHQWVSHDARWITFRSWIEDVLFESKLASMCLMPKIINEEYLRPDEVAFMLKHVPSFRRHGQKASSNSNAVVFTHTYDSLVMERVTNANGHLCGYKLLRKCYRRRKPEMRSHSIKWVDDKSTSNDITEPATLDDQRRIDIAWRVVQHWLRHHTQSANTRRTVQAEVLQLPPYDALDANYHVTWSQFAQWINTLLEQAPAEIQALKEASQGLAMQGDRVPSLRRVPRSNTRDPMVSAQKIERLQAVYNKFRAVVDVSDSVSLTWHTAKHSHRKAFENFFVGWKPLSPSMTCPAHKASRKAVATAASLTRSPASVDTAPPENTAAAAAVLPGRRNSRPASRGVLTSTTATDTAHTAAAVRAADCGADAAQAVAAQQATLLANLAADSSFSLWALSRGLGAAVPPLAAPPTAEQMQHTAEVLGLQLGAIASGQPSCNLDCAVRAVAAAIAADEPRLATGWTVARTLCTVHLARWGRYLQLQFAVHLMSPQPWLR